MSNDEKNSKGLPESRLVKVIVRSPDSFVSFYLGSIENLHSRWKASEEYKQLEDGDDFAQSFVDWITKIGNERVKSTSGSV
jgi:hypothetical protein